MSEAEVKHGPDERFAAAMDLSTDHPERHPGGVRRPRETSMKGSHTVKAIVGCPPIKSASVLDGGAGVAAVVAEQDHDAAVTVNDSALVAGSGRVYARRGGECGTPVIEDAASRPGAEPS
jgi:hypothetical protein